MTLQETAKETLAILDRGHYETAEGRVDIARLQQSAEAGTELIRPQDLRRLVRGPRRKTGIEQMTCVVTGEKTQEAARRLVQEEGVTDLVLLNFASAKNPGGGFLRGARAQEEDLVRSGGLYRCLLTQPDFYEANRRSASMLYTDHIIYSPKVPWFRGADGGLLAQPYVASVITAPAPNAREFTRKAEGREQRIRDTLVRRAGHILALAEREGHGFILLGAWGCGVFGNDPGIVADAFMSHLESSRFRQSFAHVLFAVYEPGATRERAAAFERRVRAR